MDSLSERKEFWLSLLTALLAVAFFFAVLDRTAPQSVSHAGTQTASGCGGTR